MPLSSSPSEVTLVAPTVLTYTLAHDNPSNTAFLDLSSSFGQTDPAFTVKTEFTGSKTVTNVKNAQGETLASLEWRELLSDKVTVRGKPPVALSSWMKSGFLPNSPVTFQDDMGKKYQWRNVAPGLEMELYADDSPGGPIAAFRKSRVNRMKNTSTPATFLMTTRAMEIAETCVISFLFLEKKRRMRDNSSQNRADVLGSAVFSARGGTISGGGV